MKIKDASRATHLLKRADVSGLERWETCPTEIARMFESLKENTEAKTTDLDKLHYEDKSTLQRNFAAEVRKVYHGFEVNPFEEINLVNISNHLYLMTKKQESH